MKIQQNPHIAKQIQPKPTDPAKDTNGPTFGDALRDAMAPAAEQQTAGSTPGGPANISRMQFDAALAAQPQVTLSARVEHFLDLLETYQNGLSNPNANMKTMAPLVDRIDSESRALAPELNELADDHPLKPVLNQALVMAAKETVLFKSGSYIDA